LGLIPTEIGDEASAYKLKWRALVNSVTLVTRVFSLPAYAVMAKIVKLESKSKDFPLISRKYIIFFIKFEFIHKDLIL